MSNEISVPWQGQSTAWWDDTCVRIIEHFGLPGDKYTTEVGTENMKFFFKDEREALLCRLMISDQI